jgi:hypothetical protein
MESIQLPESVVINLIIFYVFLNEDVDFGYPTQRQPTHFASSFVTKWVYRKMAFTTIYPSNNMEHQVLKQWIFRIFSPKFETIPEALYYW